MYVLGATNNTIIHECVHWDNNQKAFVLARLYNKDLTNIGLKLMSVFHDYCNIPEKLR